MIQSVTLSPAEALLINIERERHEKVVADSRARLEDAVKSLYASHNWEWGKVKGQLQKDPLDQNILRFVYDDGVATPESSSPEDPAADQTAPKPKLSIVEFQPEKASA